MMFMCETETIQLVVVGSVATSTSPKRSLTVLFLFLFLYHCYVGQTKPTHRMLKFKDKHKTYLCVLGNYLTLLFRWRLSFRGGLPFRVDQITERKSLLMYNTPSYTRFYNSVQKKCHLETRKEPFPQLGGKSNEKSCIFHHTHFTF